MSKHDQFAVHIILGCVLVGLMCIMAAMCGSEAEASPPVIVQRPPALPPSVGPLSSGDAAGATLPDDSATPTRRKAALVGLAPAESKGRTAQDVPALSVHPFAYDPPSQAERKAVFAAIDRCHRVSRRRADYWLTLVMVRLERELGTPPRLLTAAACSEVALGNPDVKGDGGKSWGPLQQHPWWVDWCPWDGEDRRADPEPAVRCYWSRVQAVLPKVRRRCPKEKRAVLVAWSWVAGGKARTGGYSCAKGSKHVVEAGLL